MSTETAAGAVTLDLTALLDVLFMLLVFFLLTANSQERALNIDLPWQGASQAQPLANEKKITLTLHSGEEAAWEVNGVRLGDWSSVEQTLRQLHEQQPKAEIIIAADRMAPSERLLQALAFLQGEGLVAAKILMDAEQMRR